MAAERRVPEFAVPAAVFLASRLLGLCAGYVATLLGPIPSLVTVLTKWDAGWYIGIAAGGYPDSIPPDASVAAGQSPLAFFPGFPLVIRAVEALGVSFNEAAVLISVAAGTAAAVVLWHLARELTDRPTANAAVALFSVFPGAFVLSMGYSEGLFLLCAAACLLALLRERWAVAGVAAAVAGATRPTGLVLAVTCAWAAGVAIRRRRTWRPLLAPALAPLGFAAWTLYLHAHTGDAFIWTDAHRQGWGQGLGPGVETFRKLGRLAVHPLADFNILVSGVVIVVTVAGVVLLWRWRPPSVLSVYTAGLLVPVVFGASLTSTPRFVLPALPLFIAAGRRLRGPALHAVLGLFAGAMAILMIVAGASILYTP